MYLNELDGTGQPIKDDKGNVVLKKDQNGLVIFNPNSQKGKLWEQIYNESFLPDGTNPLDKAPNAPALLRAELERRLVRNGQAVINQVNQKQNQVAVPGVTPPVSVKVSFGSKDEEAHVETAIQRGTWKSKEEYCQNRDNGTSGFYDQNRRPDFSKNRRIQMPSLSRIMGNDVPMVANVPVFASATGLLLNGGLLNLVTGSTATGTFFGITTSADTAQGKRALGPLMINDSDAFQNKENLGMNAAAFRFGTSGIPNRGAVTGYNWMPATINQDQLNYAIWDQTSANVISANITVSTGTVVTITSSEASIAGAWLFSTDTSAAGNTSTFSGSLRYVSLITAGTGTIGLTTAFNASTNSTFVLMRPWNHRLLQLDTTARFLMSTSAAGAGISLAVYDNCIAHSNSPLMSLRFHIHDGIDGLAVKSVKLMSEVLYLNHAFRSTLA